MTDTVPSLWDRNGVFLPLTDEELAATGWDAKKLADYHVLHEVATRCAASEELVKEKEAAVTAALRQFEKLQASERQHPNQQTHVDLVRDSHRQSLVDRGLVS
jgi:hypothetical protein